MSIDYRIAIGPHAGRKALTLYSVEKAPHNTLLACLGGVSLHAATSAKPGSERAWSACAITSPRHPSPPPCPDPG